MCSLTIKISHGRGTGAWCHNPPSNNSVKFTPKIVNLGYDCAIMRQVELI